MLFFGLFLSLFVIVLFFIIFQKLGFSFNGIREQIISYGNLGIIILIFLMVLSVMSPLPDTPIAITSTIVFGPIIGFLIIFTGGLIGAILDFLIIRKLGREYITKRFPNAMFNINNSAAKFGFEAMVLFRIFPTVTFDIASYTAALTKVRLKTFVFASAIGLIAPAISYAILGEGINSGKIENMIFSIFLGLAVVGIVIILTRFVFNGWNINKLDS